MVGLRLVVIGILVVASQGCSGQPSGRIDNDPGNYARTIKTRVLEFVDDAKQNSKGIALEAAVLLETLEIHPSQPVGDHKSTYELMTQRCKSLVEAAKRSPTSAEVGKLLRDLTALANQLPN